ncbi:MAG: polysaccharide deacetylase family protein [Myxococcales bacterium FL481]|nr:MAG: polysaccharide deacetylase family protein [Myxococcales bacterium FL481]
MSADVDPAESAGFAPVYFGPRDRPRLALTFDDGPSGRATVRILQVLRQLDVRATFFVEGRRVKRDPALTRRIVAGGHQIANHAHTHRSFRSLFPSEIVDELTRTQAAIAKATGVEPGFVRPPFGRFAPSAVPLIAGVGLRVVLWDVDSGDWHRDPLQIVRGVVRQVRPGSIVLMHDRKPQTAVALPDLVSALRRRGYTFVTVAELLGSSPYHPVRFVDDPASPLLEAERPVGAVPTTQAVAAAAGILARPRDGSPRG